MPSLPAQPLKVIKEVGAPRPASHNHEFGGMQVAVGNIKLEDGMWDLCFSLVVNNVIRGAYGAALLMAEYHLYLQSHPKIAAQMLEAHQPLDPVLSSAQPQQSASSPVRLPALDALSSRLPRLVSHGRNPRERPLTDGVARRFRSPHRPRSSPTRSRCPHRRRWHERILSLPHTASLRRAHPVRRIRRHTTATSPSATCTGSTRQLERGSRLGRTARGAGGVRRTARRARFQMERGRHGGGCSMTARRRGSSGLWVRRR